jgi:hypothetical protein
LEGGAPEQILSLGEDAADAEQALDEALSEVAALSAAVQTAFEALFFP